MRIYPEKGILKKFLDSRLAWNSVVGLVYNHLILKASPSFYFDLLEEINLPEKAKVLDVGSGPGFFTLEIAKKFPTVSVVGLDYSSRQVKLATSRANRENITNSSFIVGNAMNLPFKKDYFDLVISIASIKHWPNGEKGLVEIKRVLKKRGVALIAEVDSSSSDKEIHDYVKKITTWYVNDSFLFWGLKRVIIGKSYSMKEAELLAENVGFEKILAHKIPGWPFFSMKLVK